MKSLMLLVLVWIDWWHLMLAENNTKEVCALINNKYWIKYLDEKVYDKQLSENIEPSIAECQRQPNLDNEHLKNSLKAIERLLSCQFTGHLLEFMVMLDTLAASVSDRLKKDQNDSGFVQQSREFWQAWRFEALPWLIQMRPTIALWTGTFRKLHQMLIARLKVSLDFEDLLEAVESFNLYLNGKALQPIEQPTAGHEAYTRVSLTHAYVQHALYRFFKSECKQAEWMKTPWPTEEAQRPQSTRTAISQRMKSVISALTGISLSINIAHYKEKHPEQAYPAESMVVEFKMHPNFFVKPGTIVKWWWNGVKTNVYQVYREIQKDYRDDTGRLYYMLSVRTIMVTFFTYLSRYLQIYIEYVMVKGGERFAKKAKNDPAPLQCIRLVIAKMALFSRSNLFDHIYQVHQRIEKPLKHVGTLSVFDLQLMVNNYVNVVNHILEVQIEPIPVIEHRAGLVLDELLDMMLYSARPIIQKKNDEYYIEISTDVELAIDILTAIGLTARIILMAL